MEWYDIPWNCCHTNKKHHFCRKNAKLRDFFTNIYDNTLLDSFPGSAGFINSAASFSALTNCAIFFSKSWKEVANPSQPKPHETDFLSFYRVSQKKSIINFFGAGDGIPRKNFIGDFFLGHPVSFCIFVIPSIFLSVFMSFRLSDFLSNFLSFCRSCFGHLCSYKFIYQLH